MYIIELFFKLKEKFKNRKNHPQKDLTEDISARQEENEEEKCEHIFSAIDSTNTILACTKCGYLIHCKSDEFKKKNIFENNINDKI